MSNDRNRARQAADAVVEAACLFAVISLPLYFTVLTGTGYEADKAVLFRVIAIVAGLGWAAGALVSPGRPRRRYDPLLWLALLLFAVYVLASLTSIDPRLSLWGSQTRQQGLWTRAGYLVVAVCVATRLRAPEKVSRLVTAVLFGSLPVVAYGLIQALGTDPIPSTGDPNTLYWPVRSSLGQHIFLGSYLIMVIPFAAARVVSYSRDAKILRGKTVPLRPALLAIFALGLVPGSFVAVISLGVHHPALYALLPAFFGVYALLAVVIWRLDNAYDLLSLKALGCVTLLLAQIVVLAASGARGAWLGLLAGIPVFGILLGWRLRRPRLWQAILAVSLAGGLFLFLLNLPQGPLQALRSVHGLNRLANITESGGAGGSAQGRILIWQGVVKLASTTPGVGGSWGGPLRDLVGYGPDTMHWAFQPVFPLKLRQVTSEIWTWDRAHNIYLDSFIDAGALGLAAFLAVIAVFYWTVGRALLRVNEPSAWILIAAGTAVTSHLIDGFFGLDTAVTLLLFWLCVGLAAAAAHPLTAEEKDPELIHVRAVIPLLASCLLAIALTAFAAIFLPMTEHPNLIAWFWLASIVFGIGVVVLGLLSPGPAAGLQSALPRRRLMVLAAVGLASALALGSQARFEGAAMAERQALDNLSLGRTVDAIGYLQEASILNGREPQYRTELGGAFLDLALSKPAPNPADPTYLLSSPQPETMSRSAIMTLPRAQLLQLSETSLEAARAQSPLDPDVYGNLGNLYLQSTQVDRALADFAVAQRLSPRNPRYLDQEALAQLQAGRTTQAMTEAQQALRLDDTFWYSHYTVALVHHAVGASQDARAEAALALYWMRNYWPQPPVTQIAQLRTLARTG